MENPMSWGEVRNAIAEAQEDAVNRRKVGLCGSSEVTLIYQKLRDKGFLKSEFENDPMG